MQIFSFKRQTAVHYINIEDKQNLSPEIQLMSCEYRSENLEEKKKNFLAESETSKQLRPYSTPIQHLGVKQFSGRNDTN